jgi:beta-glucanase (GH16 family)
MGENIVKSVKCIILGVIIAAVVGSVIAVINYKNKTKAVDPVEKLSLFWSDEFDGTNGSGVDASKWVHDVGGEGWGNNEEEYYTEGNNNCYIQDGSLVIEAKKENMNNSKYTSARIKTKGKLDFKYGKIEMRAKIPYGQGIWPAFWMLGSNIEQVNWPECGEIDIMENIGREPKTTHGTFHGPGYSGNMGIGASYELEEDFKNSYHIFSIEWNENKIEWFVDGKRYHSMTPEKNSGNKWVFNSDFFLIINLAVGGNWPGYPDDTTTFPQKFYIDYVRVYK